MCLPYTCIQGQPPSVASTTYASCVYHTHVSTIHMHTGPASQCGLNDICIMCLPYSCVYHTHAYRASLPVWPQRHMHHVSTIHMHIPYTCIQGQPPSVASTTY